MGGNNQAKERGVELFGINTAKDRSVTCTVGRRRWCGLVKLVGDSGLRLSSGVVGQVTRGNGMNQAARYLGVYPKRTERSHRIRQGPNEESWKMRHLLVISLAPHLLPQFAYFALNKTLPNVWFCLPAVTLHALGWELIRLTWMNRKLEVCKEG